MRRLAMFVIIVVFAACARAQFDTATVLGTVTDPTGAVVPHSQVALHNTATGAQATATTDDRGEFRFVDVSIGPYELKVTAAGFQPAVAKFELTVGAHQRVDVSLKVGTAAATVITTAEAAQLETESSEHSQVVAAKEIAELPLNGRNYSQLVALSTGVVPSPLAQQSGYLARDGSFNINGLRSTYSNYLLDGIDNNFYGTSNQGFSNQVVQLAPDSVAEFRVVTNNVSAEYGRSGGATINVVTRYGTNQFHGRAWEFVRNTDFNAEGFFKPDVGGKPALHRNQFGLNLDGPIKKDKLFFFVDYEGFRETDSFTDQASIPSLAERGLSSTGASLGYYLIDDPGGTTDPYNSLGYLPVSDPCPYAYGSNVCNSTAMFYAGLGVAGQGYQYATGGTQYVNGQIPSAAVTPFAKALLSYVPSPTNTNTYNNYVVLHPESVNKDKGDVKVDWTPKENLRLFARYSQARFNAFDPGTIPGVAGGDGDGNVRAPMKQIVAGATWTLSPVSVLEARFGFSTMEAGKTPVLGGQNTMTGNLALSGLPTDTQWLGGVTYQYFLDGGFTNLGRQPTNPQHQNPAFWNPKVNYSRLWRNHSIKTGAEFTVLHVAQEDLHPVLGANVYGAQISGTCYQSYYKLHYAYLSGLYGFANDCSASFMGFPAPTVASPTDAYTERMYDYADFLFGFQAEIGLSKPTISNLRTWGAAGYVQDDWKVNHKLSVNLGLRYEFATPISEANNYLANFDLTQQALVSASSGDKYMVNPNNADFGPRVGASYAINAKTVARGGFGISYSHWNRVGSNYLTMNPPYGVAAYRQVYPMLPGYLNVQSGFPSTFTTTAEYTNNPTEVVLQYMPRNSPDTQVRSWFFGVERDLGHNWLVDLSYVGNHGLNEVIVNDINQGKTAGTTGSYTKNGAIVGLLPWATSDYNGLQAKVEKRFSQGLYVLESFTWSKAIDITTQALDGGGNCGTFCGNNTPSVQNIYNWQADRGISAYNHPIINNTTAVWTLPVGNGQKYLNNLGALANNVVGGWQVTGIVTGRSGDPLTFGYSPNSAQQVSPSITVNGRNAYRPNQTGPAAASNKSYKQYFKVGNFATPATDGSATPFGNSPRNAVRGFDYWDVDTGLTKQFALTEKTHLVFRAEAFNVLNRTNYGDPNTSVPNLGTALTTSTSGTFGEITSSLPARVLQFAAKIVF